MRINLNRTETQKIDEITKALNDMFSKEEYTIKVIPYNNEKSKAYHQAYYESHKNQIKEYHKNYNQKRKSEKDLKKNEQKDVTSQENAKTKSIETVENKNTKTEVKEVVAKENKAKADPVKNKKS